MRRSLLLYGATLTGAMGRIIVDDPHGFVVPSEDVEIVGKRRPVPSNEGLESFRRLSHGQLRDMDMGVPMRKEVPPTIKTHKVKPKRLHRGLR